MRILILRGDMIYSDPSNLQILVLFCFVLILHDSEMLMTICTRKGNEEAVVGSSLSAKAAAADNDPRAA